jgi:hypothetical protein
MAYGNNPMMDDESSPSEADSQTDTPADKSDETEDQLALVPSHFFKDNPKPGMREMVEVVNVYENEVSIKCVYGEDKEEEAEGETPGHPAPDDSDDMMM